MADTLESLEIEVKHNASGAGKEIDKITAAIDSMSKALSNALPQLKEYASVLSSVGGSIKKSIGGGSGKSSNPISDSLKENIKEAGRYEIAVHKVADAQVRMAEAFNKGDENGAWRAREQELNATAQADKYDPNKALPAASQEFIKTASAVDVLSAKISRLKSEMQEAFEKGDTSKAFAIRGQIIQTEKALDSANKAAIRAKYGVAEAAKEVEKAHSPLQSLMRSIGRIAFYRAIRSAIKAVTQSFSEGLQAAYAFSSGIEGEGNRFAAAMDSMKIAGSQMKGQLGSAFIGLLAAIEPIVVRILNLITALADAISQIFASFTGTTYLKSIQTPQKWAKAAGGAAKAAKEWKNQLLGFDEINRLNEPSDGGGGGGGTNPLAGYELVDTPINEKLLAFINNIKDKLQPALDRCKEAFERLKEAWGRFTDSLSTDGAISRLITDLLVLGGNTVLNGLTVLADALTLILDILTALNGGDWTQVWRSFAQLIYDVVILIADLVVGITNLVVDALLVVTGVIDDLLGTHLSDWLREDNKAFNEMYEAAKNSDDGLFGLKKTLGLTESATEGASDEADEFRDALLGVSSQSAETEQSVNGIRGAVDWVLDGFRGFGGEVAAIFNSLFQPIADFCDWIASAIEGISIFNGLTERVNRIQADGSIYLQGFASGGHPDDGQLFIAREGGAEMVGSMGGRTTVATNDDIVEGIRQGVFEAVMAANNNGNNNVDVRVYLDSREIKAGQNRLNRAMGVG